MTADRDAAVPDKAVDPAAAMKDAAVRRGAEEAVLLEPAEPDGLPDARPDRRAAALQDAPRADRRAVAPQSAAPRPDEAAVLTDGAAPERLWGAAEVQSVRPAARSVAEESACSGQKVWQASAPGAGAEARAPRSAAADADPTESGPGEFRPKESAAWAARADAAVPVALMVLRADAPLAPPMRAQRYAVLPGDESGRRDPAWADAAESRAAYPQPELPVSSVPQAVLPDWWPLPQVRRAPRPQAAASAGQSARRAWAAPAASSRRLV